MLKKVITVFVILYSMSVITATAGQNAYEIRQYWQNIADKVSVLGRGQEAAKIMESINMLSDEDIVKVYGNVDFKALDGSLEAVQTSVNKIDSLTGEDGLAMGLSIKDIIAGKTLPSPEVVRSSRASAASGVPSAFPDDADLDYPSSNLCPLSPNRSGDVEFQKLQELKKLRAGLEVAKGTWSLLDRGCNQVVVVLGAGSNTSMACVAADVALFAVEAVVLATESAFEHSSACDDNMNSAEIEGIWEGIKYMNSALAKSAQELEKQNDTLAANDADIKRELAAIVALINDSVGLQKIMLDKLLLNQELMIRLLKDDDEEEEEEDNS